MKEIHREAENEGCNIIQRSEEERQKMMDTGRERGESSVKSNERGLKERMPR